MSRVEPRITKLQELISKLNQSVKQISPRHFDEAQLHRLSNAFRNAGRTLAASLASQTQAVSNQRNKAFQNLGEKLLGYLNSLNLDQASKLENILDGFLNLFATPQKLTEDQEGIAQEEIKRAVVLTYNHYAGGDKYEERKKFLPTILSIDKSLNAALTSGQRQITTQEIKTPELRDQALVNFIMNDAKRDLSAEGIKIYSREENLAEQLINKRGTKDIKKGELILLILFMLGFPLNGKHLGIKTSNARWQAIKSKNFTPEQKEAFLNIYQPLVQKAEADKNDNLITTLSHVKKIFCPPSNTKRR